MSLPLLPGFNFDKKVRKLSFHKPQKFDFASDVAMEMTPASRRQISNSEATKLIHADSVKPSWLAFDKHSLTFEATFHEEIKHVSQVETHRYRYCNILYFLEDDTIQIVEKPKRNSALPQWTILKRHKVKKPNYLCDGKNEYYTLKDLNVGVTVDIYGKMYSISDCDAFTRSFLTEIGIDVPGPLEQPEDPYTQMRKYLDSTTPVKKAGYKKDKLGQFMKFHTQVLRFYCLWDDTFNFFGSKRIMVLLYYLDDDTIQVMEKRDRDSGNRELKVLVKRGLLPKGVPDLPFLGETADSTLLNITSLRGVQTKYILDNNPLPHKKLEYYTDADLDIGKVISVWGRTFLLYDCDEFTKKFYMAKHGKRLVPIELPKDVRPVIQRKICEHNIFGSPEQSIENCFRLIPKLPKKDLNRFYRNDKYGWDSGELVFTVSIITDDPIQKERKLVLTYYLADDTIMINEPPLENSGFREGKHQMRAKVRKPDEKRASLPEYYTEKDMFIGNVLHSRGNDYLITNANEYTLNYMERNPETFPHSNVEAVVRKMQQWLREKTSLLRLYYHSIDKNNTGFIDFDVFRSSIYDIIPENVPEQELITLGRKYAHSEDTDIKLDEVLSMAQSELRRKLFDSFKDLKQAMRERDQEKSGLCSQEELYLGLLACRLPLPKDMLKALIYEFPTSATSKIRYLDFIDALNYFENPVPDWQQYASVFNINWTKLKTTKSLQKINYEKFLGDAALQRS